MLFSQFGQVAEELILSGPEEGVLGDPDFLVGTGVVVAVVVAVDEAIDEGGITAEVRLSEGVWGFLRFEVIQVDGHGKYLFLRAKNWERVDFPATPSPRKNEYYGTLKILCYQKPVSRLLLILTIRETVGKFPVRLLGDFDRHTRLYVCIRPILRNSFF